MSGEYEHQVSHASLVRDVVRLREKVAKIEKEIHQLQTIIVYFDSVIVRTQVERKK